MCVQIDELIHNMIQIKDLGEYVNNIIHET